MQALSHGEEALVSADRRLKQAQVESSPVYRVNELVVER